MANITVDQAKLVLNAFASTFQNNLISSDLVTWKQYDSEMNDRNGLVVVEQIGPRYNVTQTTSGVANLSGGVQDSVFGSEQFKINQVFGSSMGWDDFVKIRDIGEARESTALKNAATNLAEKIDAYIMSVAGNASNNWVGTPGNNVSILNDVLSAYTRLKDEGVDDSDLRLALTYGDRQALGDAITKLPALDGMATNVFRSGFTGEIGGFPAMFSQNLPQQTFGTRTNGTVAAGAQNVDYQAVAISGAPGQYMSQLFNLAGLGASTTINDGEVFTIAGVYAYDNRNLQITPRLQQFRVIGTTAVASGGTATVRIFPAIIVPGQGSTASNIQVNTAFGTVGTIPASGAVVTFLGTGGTVVKPRLMIQKEAIIVNTADLIMPATGIGSRKQLTKVPLSVRMWQNSDFASGAHSVRFDVVLTANVRDRRRVVRLNGA